MSNRTALVAGAVGRRGEALLTRLLASGDYDQVVVLADGPMAVAMPRISVAKRDELPAIDDAFILLSDPNDKDSRSYHGRDTPFVQVSHANLLPVAKAASEAGAQRLLMISPTSAWEQMGNIHRGLGDATELAVAQLPFQSVVVARPIRAATRTAASLLQRFANFYMSLQMLMVPRSLANLTSEQLARACLQAMRGSKAGIQVLSADKLNELLTPDP